MHTNLGICSQAKPKIYLNKVSILNKHIMDPCVKRTVDKAITDKAKTHRGPNLTWRWQESV